MIPKLDALRMACIKCGRAVRDRLNRLIEDSGRDAKIVDWLDEITADCPKKSARNWSDQCAARPDLAAVTGDGFCPLNDPKRTWPVCSRAFNLSDQTVSV
jgi:hypothetical protein